jgi:hypothetical protein
VLSNLSVAGVQKANSPSRHARRYWCQMSEESRVCHIKKACCSGEKEGKAVCLKSWGWDHGNVASPLAGRGCDYVKGHFVFALKDHRSGSWGLRGDRVAHWASSLLLGKITFFHCPRTPGHWGPLCFSHCLLSRAPKNFDPTPTPRCEASPPCPLQPSPAQPKTLKTKALMRPRPKLFLISSSCDSPSLKRKKFSS